MKRSSKITLYSMIVVVLLIVSGTFFVHYEHRERFNETAPLTTVHNEIYQIKKVIPSGHVVGVRVAAEGVYVLGTSQVETENGNEKPSREKLKKGDIIYKINDAKLESKEHLKEFVEANGEKPIKLEIKRKGEKETIQISPVYSQNEQTYKLGIWVKDGTQGIGTLTYIDPDNNTFGALGHGITDGELKNLMHLRTGDIMKTTITAITKGEIGEPGQISGTIDSSDKNIIGSIKSNTNLGIYGTLNGTGKNYLKGEKVPIGLREEVQEGAATILLDLEGKGIKEYAISIQKVAKYTSEPSKGMVIKIVDPELLGITNGIVQGMSGSPILQNGKLIGAITHVFIQDPTKGYGIFIENMLNNE